MKFPARCLRLLPMLCIFCLLLCGCQGSAEPGEMHLQTLAGKSFEALCETRLTAGGVVSEYTLSLCYTAAGSEVVIRSPEAHAGITVRVGNGAELVWEDVQLVIPGGEEHISLFSLLHSLSGSLTGGDAGAYMRERMNGEDVITALCSTKVGENELSHRISLAAKSGFPTESHSSADDGTTLYCRWREFTVQEG